MADNPRYALYQSEYEMLLAARATAPKTEVYTVAGRCCESGDLLGKEIPLPKAQVGEVLAVLATGAYNYSMASNYNRLPKPAVVMVKDEQARVVVRRETYEDVAAHDV
jgi:diaminopimelate decarboxylase